MLSFFAGAFAVGGCIAAAGPILIHLLNRRRYRTISWAAMDFLREAVQRNRRILQWRDWLLLLLRTLALLLFGLAMGRPYLASTSSVTDPNQPVHALLVIDNSLSMGLIRQQQSLLEEAKARAVELLEKLPGNSRIHVIPVCGSSAPHSRDPFRTAEDARIAIRQIDLVDRTGSAQQAFDEVLEACEKVPDVPAKRVIIFSDQQRHFWPNKLADEQLAKLPDVQVVDLGSGDLENSWIAEFRLQDNVADVESRATLVARIRHTGRDRRASVPVTVSVDGVEIASQVIDLEPGQMRELEFAHRFEIPLEPGQIGFARARVWMTPDALPGDDERVLSVPVVAALPVLFVDQWGEQEDPKRNRYGETFPLRRLLAPVTSRADAAKQLVQVRRTTIDALDRTAVQDVRLIVIAGVERIDPETVKLLVEYVRQGGQLILGAGGDFDAQAWHEAAWRDGAGILPLPLLPNPVGRTPEEATGPLEPFFLALDNLNSELFHIEGTDENELRDLYRSALFLKAVAPSGTPEVQEKLAQADLERLKAARALLAAQRASSDNRKSTGSSTADSSRGTGSATGSSSNDVENGNAAEALRELDPQWLLWRRDVNTVAAEFSTVDVEQAARSLQPRVLASFSNQVPYLVERTIGAGSVLFVSSGFQSSWNTIRGSHAILLFDRLLRQRIGRTIPRRDFGTLDNVPLPVDAATRRAELRLVRPSGNQESLSVDAIGPERFGVTVPRLTTRGFYQLTATKPGAHRSPSAATTSDAPPGAAPSNDEKLWELALAANGPEAESELGNITQSELSTRLGELRWQWVPRGAPLTLDGKHLIGHDRWWKRLMLLALVCLLLEKLVLAWPALKAKPVAAQEVPA